MSEEGKRDLTKTMLPIAAVAAILVITATGSIAYGRIMERVDGHDKEIGQLQQDAKDAPSRSEFNALSASIADIQTSIRDIRDYILKKNQP